MIFIEPLPRPGKSNYYWHRADIAAVLAVLSSSEIMTLVVFFQTSHYRTFQHFYLAEVCRYRRTEFPPLMSYQRLIECLPAVLVPLAAYRQTRLGVTHGIAFMDSLPLPVCHNRRMAGH
jgi:hypothetical protein